MFNDIYSLNGKNIESPSLIYYKDIIISNTKKAIEIAGGVERLWPHVKSHKMEKMIKLQQDLGINKFKCATIAEAEMLAQCGVMEIVLAYPLVGPSIDRFINLQKLKPNSKFWAIGDNYEQIKILSDKSIDAGIKTNLLIDVNMGMNRTGVTLDKLEKLYSDVYPLGGVDLQGMHCYDGHNNNRDINIRMRDVEEKNNIVYDIKQVVESKNMDCSIVIMGGTPSFPCHAKYPDVYLSPGTLFINDYGYTTNLPDLEFTPAAVIATRVISHPDDNIFTIDLGYKGIASDPLGIRGIIVGMDKKATSLFQSEEHWVFKMKEGFEDSLPTIGSLLYVIPTHICPTSALYSEVLVADKDNNIVDTWEVTARNRKITI